LAATDWKELKHYEPLPHNREKYRDKDSGDLGYLVRRDGKTWIKLDRVGQEILRPFRDGKWTAEVEHRPLTRYHAGCVTFEADKALCRALGVADLGRRDWLSLTDDKRNDWIENGPGPRDPKRLELYEGIRSILDKMTE
jgi:hypothetical protein